MNYEFRIKNDEAGTQFAILHSQFLISASRDTRYESREFYDSDN